MAMTIPVVMAAAGLRMVVPLGRRLAPPAAAHHGLEWAERAEGGDKKAPTSLGTQVFLPYPYLTPGTR